MARAIVVEIIGDAKKFGSAVNEATTKAGGLKSKLGSVGKGAAIGVGIGSFNLLTSAVETAVGSMGTADEAFKNDAKSQSQLADAYNRAGVTRKLTIDQIEATVSANQKLGVSDSDQRDGIRDFIDLTNSDTEAMKLNQAAIELSAAKGIPYADAVATIKSAVQGKTAALAKDGVAVKKGADASSIAAAILDKYAGSQEKVAQTASGKTAIANEKMGEAVEAVGGIVDKISQVTFPLLADAMTWVADNVLPLVSQAFDWLAENVFPVLQRGMEYIGTNVVPLLGQAFQWIVANIIPPIADALSWIAVNVLPPLGQAFNWIAQNVLPAVAGAISWIVDNVGPPLRAYLTFLGGTVVPALASAFKWVADNVLPPLGAAFSWIVDNVLPPVQNGLKVLTEVVIPALSQAFDGIQRTVSSVFGTVASVIKGSLNVVIGIANAMIRAIDTIQIHIGKVGMDVPGVGWVGVGPFDWNGIQLGQIPYLHQGGIVPGTKGADVLAVLQAGERVTPMNAVGGGGDTNVYIGTFVGSGADVDRLADLIAERLRLTA